MCWRSVAISSFVRDEYSSNDDDNDDVGGGGGGGTKFIERNDSFGASQVDENKSREMVLLL